MVGYHQTISLQLLPCVCVCVCVFVFVFVCVCFFMIIDHSEFPNLVPSDLVICNLDNVEALFRGLVHTCVYAIFALFSHFCAFLHLTVFRMTTVGNFRITATIENIEKFRKVCMRLRLKLGSNLQPTKLRRDAPPLVTQTLYQGLSRYSCRATLV